MEDLCERIPLLAKFVFANLDDQSLTNCRKASRRLNASLDSERLFWMRIIKLNRSHFTEHSKLWKKAVQKTPVEILIHLAVAVDRFFKWTSTEYRVLSSLEINIEEHRDMAQWTPHHIAAKAEDLQLYQYIVEKTEEINPSGSDKKTVFHFASTHGHLEVCKFIMERLEDKNPSDTFGQTPLHEAAAYGHIELCRLFIRNGVDLNCKNNGGLSLLHAAASLNKLETYKLIMDFLQDKNPPDHQGSTPLHIAASDGKLDLCRIIINSVNVKNPEDTEDSLTLS